MIGQQPGGKCLLDARSCQHPVDTYRETEREGDFSVSMGISADGQRDILNSTPKSTAQSQQQWGLGIGAGVYNVSNKQMTDLGLTLQLNSLSGMLTSVDLCVVESLTPRNCLTWRAMASARLSSAKFVDASGADADHSFCPSWPDETPPLCCTKIGTSLGKICAQRERERERGK